MADDDADRLDVIATLLRPEEAGILEGVLRSAGIAVVVRDDVLSGVNPLLQNAIGGVKLAVPAADAARAREIIAAAGAVPGGAPDERVEIPEEEWSQPAEDESAAVDASVAAPIEAGPAARTAAWVLVLVALGCVVYFGRLLW